MRLTYPDEGVRLLLLFVSSELRRTTLHVPHAQPAVGACAGGLLSRKVGGNDGLSATCTHRTHRVATVNARLAETRESKRYHNAPAGLGLKGAKS